MKILYISINDETAYEYDCSQALDASQQAFLDKMDRDMEKGIRLQGDLITHPDRQQRARFIALNLLKAVAQENHAVLSVSCAWLVSRLPDLNEVRFTKTGSSIDIELLETNPG